MVGQRSCHLSFIVRRRDIAAMVAQDILRSAIAYRDRLLTKMLGVGVIMQNEL
jgi:hypothetical protein